MAVSWLWWFGVVTTRAFGALLTIDYKLYMIDYIL